MRKPPTKWIIITFGVICMYLIVLLLQRQHIRMDTPNLEPVTVTNIVDGDTIDLKQKDDTIVRIRFIGVDTPEMDHYNDTETICFGALSKKYVETLIHVGDTVYLEYDIQRIDIYDRTLAYVRTTNDVSTMNNMINHQLVKNGYAINKAFEPNTIYGDKFQSTFNHALSSKIGLWSEYTPNQIYDNYNK